MNDIDLTNGLQVDNTVLFLVLLLIPLMVLVGDL